MTEPGTPLSRFLDEAYQDLDQLFPDETFIDASTAPLTARKQSVHVPVSCCYLTDMTGENHCQHPPVVVKPRPWTWRARDRWWDARVWLARKVAGHSWPSEEE